MKGIVFTEFLDLVEQKFGYAVVDQLLTKSNLPSGGIYTAVGTYDHSEMVELVRNLSAYANVPMPDLMRLYGNHLFPILMKSYLYFHEQALTPFDLLDSIENYIHVEVRKLYPDAELPHFETEYRDDYKLILKYSSERKMADLAHGLIEATFEYFKQSASIIRENVDPGGGSVRFIIEKSAA